MPTAHFPINVLKFCPECGSENFNADSSKSMKCGSCGFLIYFNVAAAVAALIYDENDNLLFTIRKRDPAKGTLDLPGGFVDADETAEGALKREILEELNLEISDLKYLATIPNIYLYKGITYRTLDLFFKCRVADMSVIKANDDVEDYCFLKPEDVDPEKVGLLSIRSVLEMIRKG